MSNQLVDHYESDEDPYRPQDERLIAVKVRATPESSPDPVKPQPVSPASARKGKKAKRRKKHEPSQGDTFLLGYLAPNHPDIARDAATKPITCESEGDSVDCDSDSSMEDIDTRLAREMDQKEQAERAEAETQQREKEQECRERSELEERDAKAREEKDREERGREAREREEREREEKQREETMKIAAAALDMSPPSSRKDSSEHTAPYSNGVMQEANPEQASPRGLGLTNGPFKIPNYDRNAHKSIKQEDLPSPLEVRRPSFVNGHTTESLVASPIGAHMKQADSPQHKLPALQTPGSPDGPGSPQNQMNQKLPGFQHLDQIAIKANENIRRYSVSGPSPTLSFPNGAVRSPYPMGAPSPSMHSETSPRSALSPQSGIPGQFLYSRRPSQASDYPPPLPSASTTESGYASTDGYSPSTQPTPQSETHRMSIDGAMTGTPILPPPVPSMQPLTIHTIPAHGSGGFQCDYAGCTAAPFQTQYLLNSHANVHSQNRPHYCPVPGCPRAEGGKGFKRKNEMIRHGLVHDSPGYVCPFCPDREHKYPRPDNLQRHVRVHHMDKSKDDPLLRDVLAQRPEGGGKGRRRRLGSS